MKTRCMCGKPDTIRIAHSPSITEFIGLDDNILHFKAADRYCSHCGRGLCEDCQVLAGKINNGNEPVYLRGADIRTTIKMETVTLCPDCADILEGK